jgi:hypothetical protein
VALEAALALHRDAGARVAEGRTLTALSSVLRRTGDPRSRELIAGAVTVLEAEAPGRELVSAYAQLARGNALDAAYAEAIAAAERAIQLAAGLGIGEPARALGYRGLARAALGDVQGLADMRRALELAVEQGLGHDAALLHNNLPEAVWQHEGPRAARALCAEGIDFCERRGIAAWALDIAALRLTLLAACGDSERVLADVESVAAPLEAAGRTPVMLARSAQLVLQVRRGDAAEAAAAEQLVAAAREAAEPQYMAVAFAAAAQLMLLEGNGKRATALLEELERTSGIRDEGFYAAALPGLVRCALTLGNTALATRLVAGVEPRSPLQQHALAACRAALAEAAGDRATAATAYADAVARWREFGDVPELASALLGQGRCLVALGTPGADGPLREARELFTSMGYAPALKDTDALLLGARAPTS